MARRAHPIGPRNMKFASPFAKLALKDNISANNSVILIFNGARYAEKNSG
jgi:hypothetical protein